jgi:hypothetical protein
MWDIDIAQIDVPKGFAINAVAAQDVIFTPKSDATLILNKA